MYAKPATSRSRPLQVAERRPKRPQHLAWSALIVVMSAALGACGDSDVAGRAGGDSDAGTSNADGGSACAGAGDCDDAFSCTIDTCNDGSCLHTLGPNSGATACPQGTFCTLKSGCLAAPACATAADCEKAWEGDACKSNIGCDAASSLCTFDLLDKDGDGHPPQVCGGDDCDDGDPHRYPGAHETCDGEDQDCNGQVDDGATCGGGLTCQSGSCECPPENSCGGACVDKSVDHDNCGDCFHACSVAELCVSGKCSCPSGETCDGLCVDKATDVVNCGECGVKCPDGAICSAGTCDCKGLATCGNACTDMTTDTANCGSCGNACSGGKECSGGACACPQWTSQECNGKCVNITNDSANCGGCGNACLGGQACSAAQCSCANGSSFCKGACIDTQSDPANCGDCAHACGPGYSCKSGACECGQWGTECDGACVDTSTDEANCGGCGAKCIGECTMGQCFGWTWLGAPCSADPDCGDGLTCFASTADTPALGGGPAGGYCTLTCSADAECGVGATCSKAKPQDAKGICLLECTIGPPLTYINDPQPVDKCRGREDVRCDVVGNGAACRPTCGSDSQCDGGRVCDPRLAVCVTKANMGKAMGQSCNPNAPVPECAGTCFNFGNGTTACSSPCVLGGLDFLGALDCGGATKGLCSLAEATEGAGDGGFCTSACKKQDDCHLPTSSCIRFGATPQELQNGYCFGGTEACTQNEAGQLCANSWNRYCTQTKLGYYCLDKEWPLGSYAP